MDKNNIKKYKNFFLLLAVMIVITGFFLSEVKDVYAAFPPTVTSVEDDPDPQNSEEEIIFTPTGASDPDGDDMGLYICKKSDCAKCGPTDSSECWTKTKPENFASNPLAFYECPTIGCNEGGCTEGVFTKTKNYWAKVCDTDNMCSAVVPVVSASDEWAKVYTNDSYGNGVYNSIQQTSDFGYIAAGYTTDETGDRDLLVMKLDSDGQIKPETGGWSRTFGRPNDDYANSVQQTSDLGYIVAGRTYSYVTGTNDLLVIKLDSSGNQVWSKTYGRETGAEGAYSIQQTSDSGYILAGDIYSYATEATDFLVIKLDSLGNQVWKKAYGGIRYDIATSIQQTSDSGYIVAGRTYSYGTGTNDFLVIKLDSSGNQVWKKAYGGIHYDLATSIEQTSDSGYIVAGSTYIHATETADFLVIKLDSLGNQIWSKTYGGIHDDHASSIQQTSDSGYIVTGSTNSYGSGNADFLIIKLDSSGNQVWSKTFGGIYNDRATSIQQTSDSGYIVAGYGDCRNLVLVKIDSDGNMSDCSYLQTISEDISTTISEDISTTIAEDISATITGGDFSTTIVSDIFGDVSFYEQILCPSDTYYSFSCKAPPSCYEPVITDISSDSPKCSIPPFADHVITFESDATDPNEGEGDEIKLYICKNSDCANCELGDVSGCWTVGELKDKNPSATHTCAAVATNNYWAKVCDDSFGKFCSAIIPEEDDDPFTFACEDCSVSAPIDLSRDFQFCDERVFLRWEDASGDQEAYQIQVDDSIDFSSLVFESEEIGSSSNGYALSFSDISSNPYIGNNYYWRVRICDEWLGEVCTGNWSDYSSSNLETPTCNLEMPSLKFPQTDFNWEPNPAIRNNITTFNGIITEVPGSSEWIIPDADYVGDASSSDEDPKVQFTSTGSKTVVFKATNSDLGGFLGECGNGCCETIKTVNVSAPVSGWREIIPWFWKEIIHRNF